MSGRPSSKQGEPVGVDQTFPSSRPTRRTWYRAHTERGGANAPADRGCWFYASVPRPDPDDIGGRFDLPLGRNRGTCYLASTEISAARERLGRYGDLVDESEVVGAIVTEIQFAPGTLASLVHPDAARRGAGRELSTSSPYDLGQRWADTFDQAGFDGIRYQPRFSSEEATAVAAFATAGVPTSLPPVGPSRTVADVLTQHGYQVVPPPTTAAALGGLMD